MSLNQAVPRSHWDKFLQALSGRYLEQPVDLQQERPGSPTRAIAQGLYFSGASLEGGHHPALVLQMSRLNDPESHMSHRIPDPLLLLREEGLHREIDRLVIEDERHQRTVLLFASSAPAPGPRRLTAQLERVNCDHPRCPLESA